MKSIKALALSAILLVPVCGFAQLKINELMASNAVTYADNAGEYNDWVEIFNAGSSPVNIGGMFLTDDYAVPKKWQIPATNAAATTIQPGGFLVIWADGDPVQGPLHASFKLGASGERCALVGKDGVTFIDSISFGPQNTDISYGRKPNGSAPWKYFLKPTPGKSNTTQGYNGFVEEKPIFSLPAGWYSGSQTVSITSLNSSATIRYTIDGSEPTSSSKLYFGPVAITSSTVLRAKIFVSGLIPGKSATASYFIDESLTQRGLPVTSLSTHPDYFWQKDSGIYVQSFKPEWEYPIHLEFFETNGIREEQHDGGVKILGLNSWQLPQKMLGISSDDRFGSKPMNQKFFPESDRTRFESLILRAAGSDWSYTLFNDAFIQQSTQRYTDLDIQGYRATSVFVNGQYMGIHNIRSKYNDEYLQEKYGLRKSEIDMIENDGFVEDGDSLAYVDLKTFLQNNNFASQANYDALKTKIDIRNFTDYMITETFAANASWSHNVRLWRPRTPNGKWRWMLVDFDRGFNYDLVTLKGSVSYFLTDDNPSLNPPDWTVLPMKKLMQNSNYKNYYLSRFADHLYLTFSSKMITELVTKFRKNIEKEIPYHVNRWKGTSSSYGDPIPSLAAWNANVDTILLFNTARNTFVRNELIRIFGLSGAADLNLSVATAGAGKIMINDMIVPEDTWSGKYFTDLDIKFTAIPNAGYEFVRWEGVTVPDNKKSQISVKITAATNLKAVFQKSTTPLKPVVINEINYGSSVGINTGDWIELFNPNAFPVDLSSWVFSDQGLGDAYTIPENTIINGNDYLILCNDQVSFKEIYPDMKDVVGNFKFGLSNTGEVIKLFNAAGSLVDSVKYEISIPWPNIAAQPGKTIELVSSHLDNAYGENWWGSNVAGGTPHAKNSPSRLHVGGIPDQLVETGQPFKVVMLDDYLFSPDFPANQITWSVAGNNNLNISIDPATHKATITYSGWKGSEMVTFTAKNPNGQKSSNNVRYSVGTKLPDNLTCNTTLTKAGSPYFIHKDVVVQPGCSLTVKEGVEIRVFENTDIIIRGHVDFKGTDSERIWVHANNELRWGAILVDSNGVANFDYVNLAQATFGKDSAKINAAITGYYGTIGIDNMLFFLNLRSIYAKYGDVRVSGSYFTETNIGEKINLQFSKALVENSTFLKTFGDNDAIDYDAVFDGIIRNNGIYGGEDDGIDIGQIDGVACNNVLVTGNIVADVADKGVSVGEGSKNIRIERNILVRNLSGVAVKDSSDAVLDHNTLDGNAIAVNCYEKNPGLGGGIAVVNNCIMTNSTQSSTFADAISKLTINYSLSDKEVLTGTGNIQGDPNYEDRAANDFRLKTGSPCIDTGDPASPADPNGSRTDMGALFAGEASVYSVNDKSEAELKFDIYPNPANTVINLNVYTARNTSVSIAVYDINGKLMFEDIRYNSLKTGIDITGWNTGIYFVHMVSDSQSVVKRLSVIK